MPQDKVECHEILAHARNSRLPIHRGAASLRADGECINGLADFLLPVDGPPIVAFHCDKNELTYDFAEQLQIDGSNADGPFCVACPAVYTREQLSGADAGWSLLSPVNHPVQVTYGEQRPVRTASVLLNNFDYDMGIVETDDRGWTRIGTPVDIELLDRPAQFRRRPDYAAIFPLLRAGLLEFASLTECVFDVREESDDELMTIAQDIAACCTFGRGASVSVAMLECRDLNGAVVRRIVTEPIKSQFQNEQTVADWNLPRLFKECFASTVAMRQSELPWNKLSSYCGSIEDSPYLEQNFAALMMAIEFFLRTSLLEAGLSEKQIIKAELNELLSLARTKLGRRIPKHYTAREALRLFRNAVMHGGDLPSENNGEFRLVLNKWKLLLFRLVLIRLGYQGDVVSPYKGFRGSSAVDEFAEEHNSFDTSKVDEHPWMQFTKYLKEQSSRQKSDVEPRDG